MIRTLIIIGLGVLSAFLFYENIELNDKVEFLENALAQRNLEYEWLSEIVELIRTQPNLN